MSNIEQTLSIIKPDAVERNLENDIKEMFKSNGFVILKEKKFKLKNRKQKNFTKFMKQSRFIMTYVIIFHPAQLLLWFLKKRMQF